MASARGGIINSRGGFTTRGRANARASQRGGSTTRGNTNSRGGFTTRGNQESESILGAGTRLVQSNNNSDTDEMDIQISVRNDRVEKRPVVSQSDMQIDFPHRASPKGKEIKPNDAFTLVHPEKRPGEFFCPSAQEILLKLTSKREDDQTPCFERGKGHIASIQVENNSNEVRHLKCVELVHDAKSKQKVCELA
jgi:hypothetical protein